MSETVEHKDTSFFGHPKGLAVLFLTEMWERFSYYGMRGLLVFYLTQHFLFSDEVSASMYGVYTALVYIMTIIGGTLADRYLGSRKAVTFGAILLVLGHTGMAFEGSGSKEYMTYEGKEYQIMYEGRGDDAVKTVKNDQGETAYSIVDGSLVFEDGPSIGLPTSLVYKDTTQRVEREDLYVNILYLSLALIIAGVGFLKANISTIVGDLYEVGDARRDSGFTIFYMGINLGSFLATLLCGWLGFEYGWKYGFGLAGIGMLVGLVIFLFGQGALEGRAEPPNPEKLKEKVLGFIPLEWACYSTALLIIAVSFALVAFPMGLDMYVLGLGIAIFVFLIGYAIVTQKGKERDNMFAAIYFVLAQIPFWALFEQAGSSLNLFTDRLVDTTLFGWNVPAPVFQSLNAGYIFIFAPLIAWMWIALAKKNMNPSTPVKFAIGVFLAGLGFLSLVAGMKISGAEGMTFVGFIFLIYWIHTMGELAVSPVGLSAVTKFSPPTVVGMMMGSWFLYSGLSNYLAAFIARSTGAETIGGQIVDVAAAKANYVTVYTNVGYWAMGIGVAMLIISPLIKHWMHGRD